ncbi:hypothetical protein D3C78_1373060 [compost metagenome]
MFRLVSPIARLPVAPRSRFLFRLISTLPSWSTPLCATLILLSPVKVTWPSGPMLAVWPLASVTFQPALATFATSLSWLTFTASVSSVPAVRPVILPEPLSLMVTLPNFGDSAICSCSLPSAPTSVFRLAPE